MAFEEIKIRRAVERVAVAVERMNAIAEGKILGEVVGDLDALQSVLSAPISLDETSERRSFMERVTAVRSKVYPMLASAIVTRADEVSAVEKIERLREIYRMDEGLDREKAMESVLFGAYVERKRR